MALITCPKCGKQLSERALACPQCGATKEEINAIFVEREREAAERERLRKERDARAVERMRIQAEKEAEEARIRAEKRAEWWQKNKKKVILFISVLVLLLIAAYIIPQIIEQQKYKKALQEAQAYIAAGDSCVTIYHFDEAHKFYQRARRTEAGPMVASEIVEKEKALAQAQIEADNEYNDALRRLKVFLDADEGTFNDLSNSCLDKMIQIYPDRKETKYFKKLRKK